MLAVFIWLFENMLDVALVWLIFFRFDFCSSSTFSLISVSFGLAYSIISSSQELMLLELKSSVTYIEPTTPPSFNYNEFYVEIKFLDLIDSPPFELSMMFEISFIEFVFMYVKL